MDSITIRPLLPAEYPLLRRFTALAVHTPPGHQPASLSIADDPSLQAYWQGFGRAQDKAWAAVHQQQIIGIAWTRLFPSGAPGYGWLDPHTPELSLAVEPAFRGEGVGTLLLRALLASLTADGTRQVSLSVSADNPAVRLYRRCGFRLVQERREDLLMALLLNSGDPAHTPRLNALLDHLTAAARALLGYKLIGVYVHGSIALTSFDWERSDIDLLIVADLLTVPEQRTLLAVFAEASPVPPRGLEVSVVTPAACAPFTYPTPYALHFSEAWRERYLADPDSLIHPKPNAQPSLEKPGRGSFPPDPSKTTPTDPDLATHIALTRQSGIRWYGLPIDAVFAPVPTEALRASLQADWRDVLSHPLRDPVYSMLSLCRALFWQENYLIASKNEAALWALEHLPEAFQPLLRGALARELSPNGEPAQASALNAFLDHAREELTL